MLRKIDFVFLFLAIVSAFVSTHCVIAGITVDGIYLPFAALIGGFSGLMFYLALKDLRRKKR